MKSEAINEILPPPRRQPGIEPDRVPLPDGCVAGGKLRGQVALVSGGDSGVGRAVALAFAKEGADVAFIYLDQHGAAIETARALRSLGRETLKIAVDIGDECLCQGAVDQVVSYFGKLDILVNNSAERYPQEKLENLSEAQLLRTFQSNVFSMFYLTKAALPHLKRGARIINTASIAAYSGTSQLLDYSASQGAIVAFTRSLSLALAERGILVNGVAPGPVCALARDAAEVAGFGMDIPMRRSGLPDEIACCYVFLASDASSYMSGQILHPNGGEIING